MAGLRHAKGVASAEKNAPTAMDWDTLTDFQWGSVETDFMTIAKFSPETGNKWAEVRCGAAVESWRVDLCVYAQARQHAHGMAHYVYM